MKIKQYGIFLFLFFMVALASCKKEETTKPSTDERDKFIGEWTCNEKSKSVGNTTFTMKIEASSSGSSQLLLGNFYNFGDNVKALATVSGNDVSIPKQQLSGNYVSGSGSISGTIIINMIYYVDKGVGDIDTCSAKLTR